MKKFSFISTVLAFLTIVLIPFSACDKTEPDDTQTLQGAWICSNLSSYSIIEFGNSNDYQYENYIKKNKRYVLEKKGSGTFSYNSTTDDLKLKEHSDNEWTTYKVLTLTESYLVIANLNGLETLSYKRYFDESDRPKDDVEDVNDKDNDNEDDPIPQKESLKAVDLGLPSGIKWANMNVGATAPEDGGLYFAWGETVGYTSDVSDNHIFGDESYYKWGYDKDTKYGDSSNKTVLDLVDDAAYVNMGSEWRMPTIKEIKELLDYTNDEKTTQNGVKGYRFTSKKNGNSIFLPFSGYRANTLDYLFTDGFYWSSTRDKDSSAGYMQLSGSYFPTYFEEGGNRCIGMTIRAVYGQR